MTDDKHPSAGTNVLQPGFLIHDVARLRRTVFDQRLKPVGITRSQIWVLSNLSRHDGEGISQVELARLLDMGKVTLGGLIERLEQRGLVERVADKIDRRAKRVRMSFEGKLLFDNMRAVAEQVNDEVMKGIPRHEQQVFVEVLRKMKDNLISMDALPDYAPGRRHNAGNQ
jgi:MarR family transcriptional regulator, transcriptional regulator for hemolysin